LRQTNAVDQGPSSLGVVVIGRNEGERLVRCVQSVKRQALVHAVVYVDSGSSDDSIARAEDLGASVVALSTDRPFTAARARNAGLAALLAHSPATRFVQFVDGDCEVVDGWMSIARARLESDERLAAACGRRRERYPERSVYNMLCDVEWNTAVGETKAFGGDVLVRVSAFQQVGGYSESLIAGEDPELGVRLRQAGWRLWRLDADMTWHDAALTRFSQWWKRTMRAGYAFAEGAFLHGAPPERHWVRESQRAWLWGAAIPLAIVAAAAMLNAWLLAAFAVYPLQWMRVFINTSGPFRQRAWQAFFLVVGKFAEAAGQVRFMIDRWTGARARLIEYK
jgi:GT2 family glycosyltransferase